jgi:histidinol dehydrogenase
MSGIPVYDLRRGEVGAVQTLRQRTLEDVPAEVEEGVRAILRDVRERGDAAVVEHTRRLDCPGFTADGLTISGEEIEAAYGEVTDAWLGAFRRAKENVFRFQERARQASWLEAMDGLLLGHQVKPLASAGLYVPAGKAPLPSSLLMTAGPAKVAGVERVVLATPPRRDGSVDPTMLVAAAECGVDEAYRMGGAQAIAALAYGTETVAPVAKIVGPGSPWVSVAKKLVFGTVGIESIAGPSESLIIADSSAPLELVAADLLTQAEHTGDNVVVLLTDCEALARAVPAEMERQLAGLRRSELTRASLEHCGLVAITHGLSEAVQIANDIAPEHLQVLTADPFALLAQIENAGCIFLGPLAPVPLGDYAAGPSHVLPTYGTARFSSPLSVNDFLKTSSVIYATPQGFGRLAKDVQELANGEGLTGHAAAVRRRG